MLRRLLAGIFAAARGRAPAPGGQAPATAPAHTAAGIALSKIGRLAEAANSFRAALACDPAYGPAFAQLCALLYRLGDEAALRETLAMHAAAAQSAGGAAVLRAVTLPSLLDSREEIRAVRARLQAELDALYAAPPSLRDPAVEVGGTAFNLAYQGEDDRALQERIAALHLRACPDLAFAAPHCRAPRARGARRLRVGIASTFLHDHSIGRVMRGLFARIDRTRFTVHGFAFQSGEDAVLRAMKADADEWVTLGRDYRAARERMAAAELDVLLYPDIGMDPLTYFLAFARLAPVQCTTWGHPVTSGVPALDYFISTEHFEPVDGERQYSERLVRLADVALPGFYYRPQMPPPAPAPGFDRGRRVYFCPQMLFKLHPDFDAILADILRRDPGGEVVITHKGAYDAHRLARLQARLQRNAADVYPRIVFLLRTPGAEGYWQRLRACDVVLDTVHYCGGNTSLEAISAGAPVVTLPSGLQRGRHTYGFFRKMGFTETVASSPEDYATLAVRIATDRDFARHVRETQGARAAALYEDESAVRQIEALFERAYDEAAGGGH